MNKRHGYHGATIRETLTNAHFRMKGDLAGFWLVVSSGRVGFGLEGGDLREFVFLYVLTLVSHGGIVVDVANDGVHYWARTDRYGVRPEEIARAVTEEWIDQGEPDPPAYDSIAFALPSYLDEPENRRDWPKPHIEPSR